MQKSLLSGAALTALLVSGAAASVQTVETVVITATRTEQPTEKTGASISVISANDLKTQQTVMLSDVLKQVPSLVVNRTGGIGQTTTVSIRGAEQGQTVTLIDGIRINDPSDVSEGTVFGDVMANNISRVEILRGPQSTLYGSDAIGGVINIISKRGGDTPIALQASLEGGSFGTFHANAAANGRTGDVEYGAAVNYFTNSGISAADSRNGNSEADGYRNYGATFNVRVHLADNVSADARGYYTNGHDRFDDNFGGPPNFLVADSAASNTNELKAGYLGLNADFLGGRFQNRIAIIATSSGRQFFDSAFDSIHLNFDDFGNAVRFEYQGIVDFHPDTQLSFGVETQNSSFRGDSFSSFAPAGTTVGKDRLTGYYAQIQETLFEQLTLTGGVRLDDDEEFGTHTSFKLNGAWQLPGWDATLRANVGNGFKAPTLFQLFSANSNPIAALKPETATGWEIGFDKSFWEGGVRGSLTYFDRTTTNQIDFQNCFTATDAPGCKFRLDAFGYYINIDKTRSQGVEALLEAKLADTLTASLNWTDMSATNELTGKNLARRPHDLASAVITWRPLPGATLGGSVTYQGKRFNDAGNLTRLTSNTTVNLFGSYDLTDRWQLFGRIDNLFNDRTEQVLGNGVPGIGVYAGARAAF
ncbi:MAG: TonB-dependent receptor plug domain-containing protein [Rhizomicrobium sp.]